MLAFACMHPFLWDHISVCCVNCRDRYYCYVLPSHDIVSLMPCQLSLQEIRLSQEVLRVLPGLVERGWGDGMMVVMVVLVMRDTI